VTSAGEFAGQIVGILAQEGLKKLPHAPPQQKLNFDGLVHVPARGHAEKFRCRR